jgi:hypothetical protein
VLPILIPRYLSTHSPFDIRNDWNAPSESHAGPRSYVQYSHHKIHSFTFAIAFVHDDRSDIARYRFSGSEIQCPFYVARKTVESSTATRAIFIG